MNAIDAHEHRAISFRLVWYMIGIDHMPTKCIAKGLQMANRYNFLGSFINQIEDCSRNVLYIQELHPDMTPPPLSPCNISNFTESALVKIRNILKRKNKKTKPA